ncbi:MAG: sensor histidine kinase [Chloroflexota bacterium]
MGPLDYIRRRLGVKLLLSYLIIILVGVISLFFAAQLWAPAALAGHAERMQQMLEPTVGSQALVEDLNDSFLTAVSQILVVAAGAALLTAAFVSAFVTRRLVGPIQRVHAASRRIAAGEYDERIDVPGDDELAELARAFNHMAQKLAETEARRSRLIGDVAHELRTPLGNVTGLVEGMTDGVLPAGPQTLHDAQRELNRLQRLVQDLEALSRAEAGQLLLEPETVYPSAFIEEAVARLRPQYEDKGVALAVQSKPRLPLVTVDKWRMSQVMLNLLGNALQYTPPGGQVEITARESGGEIVVRVADTGVGIAAEHLPHVFERFYRVDKSRARAGGGSGIGLTIARHLVRAHGGRIWAESEGPGQGSAFTFTLPL